MDNGSECCQYAENNNDLNLSHLDNGHESSSSDSQQDGYHASVSTLVINNVCRCLLPHAVNVMSCNVPLT
jgi:hypothetical protein